MKKIVSLILAVAFVAIGVLSLASCTKSAKVKVIDIALTNEQYAYGVKKGDSDLLAKVNTFLKKITSDGTFDAIVNKYFGDGKPSAVTSATKDSSKDQLVVATNAAFAPFEYKEGDSYYGIDMEIMKALADYLGKELVIDNMDFNAVCTSVGQGLCDIAAAGLTVNETRKEIIDFSNTYYNASQMLIVKSDDTTFDACKTVADVEAILGKYTSSTKVGTQNGTTGYFYSKGDADWGFDGFPFTTVGYDNGALAVQAMQNGSVSFVIIDEAPAKKIVESVNN